MKRALALSALLLLLVARPAQTVGVEAWHDSTVPAAAFTAVRASAVPASVAVSTPPAACREWALGCRRYPAPATAGTAEVRTSPSLRLAPATAAVRIPAATVRAASVTGTASTYGPGFGGYLALPSGPGHKVRICGAGGCIDRVSNDEGPVPSLHRVADLDVADFEFVSGLPWTRGLCRVSVEVLAP